MTTELRPEERCLSFTNTAHWHASAAPYETIHSYSDLLDWACRIGMLAPADGGTLGQAALARPAEAAEVHRRAIALREAIYRLLVGYIHSDPPADADLLLFNQMLWEARGSLCIQPLGDGFAWAERGGSQQLDRVWWPLAISAADLLTSGALLPRVGQCADDRGCGWLFLDMSKNHSRRWCDINDCGNRAKQRRHYQRSRQ